MVFAVSLLDAQHEKDSVENSRQARLLYPWKSLNGILPSLCGTLQGIGYGQILKTSALRNYVRYFWHSMVLYGNTLFFF